MRKMSEEAFYESPRLKKAMERLSSFPLSFLCAGSGYGKSLLVRHFFQTSGTKSLYFLFSGSELSAQYERFLCLLDEKNLPLAQALRVVGFPGDEWSFLKAMKLVKKALKNEEFYLCLDDAQAVAENPAFASFLRYWEQEKIPGGHLFVLSRELPEVPLAHYQLKNEVGFLEGKTLALNEKETRDFLLFRGLSLSEELVRKIAEKSEGWIAAVELYVRAIKETGQLSPELGIQALFKEAFYGALKAEERLLLSRLAPFEEFTIPFAIEATGDAEIAPLLSQLAANNAFTAEERGFFRFHEFTQIFLKKAETSFVPLLPLTLALLDFSKPILSKEEWARFEKKEWNKTYLEQKQWFLDQAQRNGLSLDTPLKECLVGVSLQEEAKTKTLRDLL